MFGFCRSCNVVRRSTDSWIYKRMSSMTLECNDEQSLYCQYASRTPNGPKTNRELHSAQSRAYSVRPKILNDFPIALNKNGTRTSPCTFKKPQFSGRARWSSAKCPQHPHKEKSPSHQPFSATVVRSSCCTAIFWAKTSLTTVQINFFKKPHLWGLLLEHV